MARKSRDNIKERIKDAAIECALRDGMDLVQVAQIAKKAGMSTRTVNRYYPEKDALLADAATKYLWGFYVSFVEEFEKMPKDGLSGREKLLLLLSCQRDFCKTDTMTAMMMIDLRFYRLRHSSELNSVTIPGSEKVKRVVIDCLEEGRADGSIRAELDNETSAMLFSVTYNGMMQRLTMIYRSGMPEEVKEKVFLVFDQYYEMVERYLTPDAVSASALQGDLN